MGTDLNRKRWEKTRGEWGENEGTPVNILNKGSFQHTGFQYTLLLVVCYTAVFRVVTQRSSPLEGGALRDDTKNGCVADYLIGRLWHFLLTLEHPPLFLISPQFFSSWIFFPCSIVWTPGTSSVNCKDVISVWLQFTAEFRLGTAT